MFIKPSLLFYYVHKYVCLFLLIKSTTINYKFKSFEFKFFYWTTEKSILFLLLLWNNCEKNFNETLRDNLYLLLLLLCNATMFNWGLWPRNVAYCAQILPDWELDPYWGVVIYRPMLGQVTQVKTIGPIDLLLAIYDQWYLLLPPYGNS